MLDWDEVSASYGSNRCRPVLGDRDGRMGGQLADGPWSCHAVAGGTRVANSSAGGLAMTGRGCSRSCPVGPGDTRMSQRAPWVSANVSGRFGVIGRSAPTHKTVGWQNGKERAGRMPPSCGPTDSKCSHTFIRSLRAPPAYRGLPCLGTAVGFRAGGPGGHRSKYWSAQRIELVPPPGDATGAAHSGRDAIRSTRRFTSWHTCTSKKSASRCCGKPGLVSGTRFQGSASDRKQTSTVCKSPRSPMQHRVGITVVRKG